ncbi:hypothetical protein P879_00863 [Paragonimus westermani]|uniref:Solute carrier family 3 (Neutral and basic amino acid transporter), member 1 n=1 Tax=Paragonimus westermani TaxID=34504 RepID=A0A8T0DUH0_9TREM|nr:hypothetical protein P879_00863 [Paragonimus westermani]
MACTREYRVYTLDDNEDRGSVIDMPTYTAAESRGMNRYLTREELKAVEDVEPVWRRLRIGLLVTFCVIWVALLVSVITIVMLTEKCPPRPDLKFWQSSVAYYVDPFAFKDSDGNWIGDLNGLQSEMSYIQDSVGAGFVILTSIFHGHFTNDGRNLGQLTDFEKIDPVLGTMSDFRNLLKTFRRQGLEVIISLDINGIAENHTWSGNSDYLERYDFSRNLPNNQVDTLCSTDNLLSIVDGTPIVYYGSELGTRMARTAQPPGRVYPMNKVPNVHESADESVLTCQLPMPWDQTGKRFSNDPNRTDQFSSYLTAYRVTETLESVSAIGRGPNLFSVVKKLIQLRAAPSLLWGEFEIMTVDPLFESKRLEMFIRKAIGFPAFVIVFDNPLLAPDEQRTGIVIDLSGVCGNVIARVVHPPRAITEDMQFKTENIYISMDSYPSIHVFECSRN